MNTDELAVSVLSVKSVIKELGLVIAEDENANDDGF